MLNRLEKLTGAEKFGAEISQIRTNLFTEKFRLVILGQFKRGKTTFINALLSADVLPTDVIPVTATITEIQYRDQPGALVSFFDQAPKEIGTEELHHFISESENPKNKSKVDKVDVYYPAAVLEHGFTLVDTPGVGSIHEHNSRLTREYIPQADAAIFLLSADPPVTEIELSFLKFLEPLVPKLFYVLNKKDYLDEKSLVRVIEFNQQVLQNALAHEIEIMPLSARQALQGQINNHPEQLKESGLPRLQKELESFLLQERGKLFLTSNLTRFTRVCQEWKNLIEIDRRAREMTGEQLSENLQKFNEYMKDLDRHVDRLTFLLEGIKTRILEYYDRESQVFFKQTCKSIHETALDYGHQHLQNTKKDLVEEIEEIVNQQIVDTFEPFRLSVENKIAQKYKEHIDDLGKEVSAIVQEVYRYSASLFKIERTNQFAESAWKYKSEFTYKTWENPSNLQSMERVLVLSLPRFLFMRRLKKQLKEQIASKTDRQIGRLRGDLFYRLTNNNNDFLYEFKNHLERIREAISTLITKNLRLKEEGDQELQETGRVQQLIWESLEKLLTEAQNLQDILGNTAKQTLDSEGNQRENRYI